MKATWSTDGGVSGDNPGGDAAGERYCGGDFGCGGMRDSKSSVWDWSGRKLGFGSELGEVVGLGSGHGGEEHAESVAIEE